MVHEKPGYFSTAQARMNWTCSRSFGVKSADWVAPFAHCKTLKDAKALREKMRVLVPGGAFEIVPDCMAGPSLGWHC